MNLQNIKCFIGLHEWETNTLTGVVSCKHCGEWNEIETKIIPISEHLANDEFRNAPLIESTIDKVIKVETEDSFIEIKITSK